jgi:hypothetical protein
MRYASLADPVGGPNPLIEMTNDPFKDVLLKKVVVADTTTNKEEETEAINLT